MSKFKVGDKVRVRPDLEVGKTYGTAIFVEFMEHTRGCITTIKKVDDFYDAYRLEDCGNWDFTDEMLMPAAPTIQEIKDKKMSCVVHTKTKTEAELLIECMPVGEWTRPPLEYWDKYGDQTGYYIEKGVLSEYGPITFYKSNPYFGEIYEFSDITASGDVIRPEISAARTLYAEVDELTQELYRRLGIISTMDFDPFKPIKKKTKEDNHMTFTTTKGERYTSLGKHKGKTIPTITTTVNINGRTGSATCDEADYNERDGVLNAIANAYCYGNFDREYRKAVKEQEKQKKHACTCGFCGEVLESPEAKTAHEAWHVERKKAKHERYLIRKEAKRRLAEAEREGKIEKVMKELYKKEGK